ncbi:hypothetical protein [Ensifer soli]|uniref:hypothetical protein n=1 Tax=Ciceribacter sp. sgz301302 TaxID=3342379 RepID=UPI0035B9F434
MTNIYSADIMICATVYVRAATREQALQSIANMDRGLELREGGIISGRGYDDPRLPDLSLSPAMTVYPPSPSEIDLEQVS